MKKEERKSKRRNIRHLAIILNSDKSIVGPCTVLDVSTSGAKIVLNMKYEVPDEFILMLAKGGKVIRHCKVARKTDSKIGIQFVDQTSITNN